MENYFDAAATTPLDPRVIAVMEKHMEKFGNNNSRHVRGFEAQKVIDESLSTIADLLGVTAAQLAVTYSGTDSNRRFLWACSKRFGWENITCSRVEHSSISNEIDEKNCFCPRGACEEMIQNQPKVLAQMKANAETGELFDSKALRKKFPDALILEDWSQAIGKGLKFDIDHVDAVSFAPQKIYGPKMVGLLYLKNPEDFPELSKDRHTKNCWLIAGMAEAFRIAFEEESQTVANLKKWTEQIETCVKNIPDTKIHSSDFDRVPGTISAAFKGLRGAELMSVLSEKEGICVSTGSACTSDILTPTKTIAYIEKDPEWQYPIRISLHKFLTDEAVENFCETLKHYVEELRK
jgi:cysteine desulfurase